MAARFLPVAEKLARYAMNRRGMASRFVDATTGGGVRLHVYDGPGTGALPPMVVVHGLGSAGAAFAGVVARLRPHVKRVIVPELPGHGFSTRGTERVTPANVLDAVAEGLDALVREPFVLYGSSLGGGLALKYAVAHPERVKALVLVSPAGAQLPDEDWRALVERFDIRGRDEARRFLERLYHRPPWFLGLVAREFPDLLARPAVKELLESATQSDAPRPDELATLKMPILFLWGRSEKLLPAAALAYFRAHLPAHAVIEEPEGFGHTPQLEAPVRLADRIIDFVRALPDDGRRPSHAGS